MFGIQLAMLGADRGITTSASSDEQPDQLRGPELARPSGAGPAHEERSPLGGDLALRGNGSGGGPAISSSSTGVRAARIGRPVYASVTTVS